jgi:hypothetical protein
MKWTKKKILTHKNAHEKSTTTQTIPHFNVESSEVEKKKTLEKQ